MREECLTYTPELDEVLSWCRRDVQTVWQAPAQEQHKKLVICKIHTIVYPETQINLCMDYMYI